MAGPPIPPLDFVGGIARAIVSMSDAPLLMLSGDLTVVAASLSFSRNFGVSGVEGKPLHAVGNGEWDVPQLHAALLATANGAVAVENYEMDLQLAGRPVMNLIIHAHRVEPVPYQPVLVLLSVQDTTEKHARDRLNDKLLREKTLMLAELQHRVANSLQIIASVLMQTARRLDNSDAKPHLVDAHSRVMSVAALQKQLAISGEESVGMRQYLTDLGRSIGASMIHDRSRMKILVEVDDCFVSSEVSLSIGLIVTELLINALKHAYPDGRSGGIVVGFFMDKAGWKLTVRDDGIGMPKPGEESTAGLGSSIVRALATQLEAEIAVTPADPGTLVTVTHVNAEDAGTTDADRMPV